jgi:hypothetical protein
MGQFLHVNGDYNIRAGEGAKIVLDTGDGIGEVVITGDLKVEGETVFIEAADLNVQDRIITVNFGETGAGVTLNYAGLQVDRGSLPNANIVWNESRLSWELSSFEFDALTGETPYTNSNLTLTRIFTDSGTGSGNLTLIGIPGSGVVTVRINPLDDGSEYQNNVIGPNDVPNKKYVDDRIINNPTFQITRNDSRVIVFDADDPLPNLFFPLGDAFLSQPSESQIVISVDDTIISRFYTNRIELGDLTIFTESATNPLSLPGGVPDSVVIQATNTNSNIKLETNQTGKVEIPYALQLNNEGVEPTVVKDSTLLYAGNLDGGQTGLYYYNYNGSVSQSIRGELINKNRALLYSMIF